MGADPEAILFYGFPLPNLNVDYHDLNGEWEDGHQPPTPEDKGNYQTPEWDEWRKRLKVWEASLDNVRIDWCGGENCEKYYVHCEGLQKKVEWDEVVSVSPSDLEHPAGAEALLHQFCDQFNLPKKSPQWHLAARYF